jgi:hypothetical protein
MTLRPMAVLARLQEDLDRLARRRVPHHPGEVVAASQVDVRAAV